MGSFVHLTPEGNDRLAAAIEAATLDAVTRKNGITQAGIPPGPAPPR